MKKLLSLGVAFLVALLSACTFTGSYTGPAGTVTVGGTFNPESGAPADGGTSMGRGTMKTEDGTELTGEYFDTDGDGKADKFKPDPGQGGGSGYGTTNGTDWYDIDVTSQSTPTQNPPGGPGGH